MGFVFRKYATVGDDVTEGRYFAPMAPGAERSPQSPGQLPDVSTIPGEGVLPVPLAKDGVHRPLAEYGTAQRIMHVYDKNDADPLDPKRWVQALPAYEEQRKGTPWKRKPTRPVAGYALSVSGSRLSEQLAALAEQSEAPAEDAPAE